MILEVEDTIQQRSPAVVQQPPTRASRRAFLTLGLAAGVLSLAACTTTDAGAPPSSVATTAPSSSADATTAPGSAATTAPAAGPEKATSTKVETSDPDALPSGVVGKPLTVSLKTVDEVGATAAVTINSAKRFTPPKTGYAAAATNGSYLLLDVTIVSKKGKVTYNPLYFKARGTDGQEYTPELMLVSSIKGMQSGELRSGQKVRGTIAFDAPKGDMEIDLTGVMFDDVASWQIKS